MARNEVFTTNKIKFINIAALVILVIFVWLNLRALIIDIGITLVAFIGGINYINKLMSQVRITDEEISYRSIIKKRSMKLEDIIGIDCKKRPFSKVFGGNLYELGVFNKMILVGKDEKLFVVDSIYNHSSHLWYMILKDLIDKDIYISDKAKEAYTLILRKNIGGY